MMAIATRLLIVLSIAVIVLWVRVWRERTSRRASVSLGTNEHVRVYLFWAPGCAVCGVQKRILESLLIKSEGRISVEYMNAIDERALVSQYSVKTVPATVVLTEDSATEILHGLVSQERLEKLLALQGKS